MISCFYANRWMPLVAFTAICGYTYLRSHARRWVGWCIVISKHPLARRNSDAWMINVWPSFRKIYILQQIAVTLHETDRQLCKNRINNRQKFSVHHWHGKILLIWTCSGWACCNQIHMFMNFPATVTRLFHYLWIMQNLREQEYIWTCDSIQLLEKKLFTV